MTSSEVCADPCPGSLPWKSWGSRTYFDLGFLVIQEALLVLLPPVKRGHPAKGTKIKFSIQSTHLRSGRELFNPAR